MDNEKKKILVIDDDDVLLSAVKAILETEYNAVIARSGREALEYITYGFIPELILLDIIMPEMDGFETYSRIRAISILGQIPIVFLSSVTEQNEIKKAMNMGAADYINKPFTKRDLLTKIGDILKD